MISAAGAEDDADGTMMTCMVIAIFVVLSYDPSCLCGHCDQLTVVTCLPTSASLLLSPPRPNII